MSLSPIGVKVQDSKDSKFVDTVMLQIFELSLLHPYGK